SDVRNYVTLEGSMCLLDAEFDIGRYFKIKHWRGIEDGGWTDRPLWILSSTFNPETRRVRLVCMDVRFIDPLIIPTAEVAQSVYEVIIKQNQLFEAQSVTETIIAQTPTMQVAQSVTETVIE